MLTSNVYVNPLTNVKAGLFTPSITKTLPLPGFATVTAKVCKPETKPATEVIVLALVATVPMLDITPLAFKAFMLEELLATVVTFDEIPATVFTLA